jgi:hypothetical protein
VLVTSYKAPSHILQLLVAAWQNPNGIINNRTMRNLLHATPEMRVIVLVECSMNNTKQHPVKQIMATLLLRTWRSRWRPASPSM